MHAAESALDIVDRLLSRLSAVAVLLTMVVILADVAGRYLFAQPMAWVYDLIAIYFINLVLYFMASETLRTRAHIALDMRARLLPQSAWTALQALAWAAVAIALALAAWQVAQSSFSSAAKGEVHPGLYEWPVWLEKGIVALGLVLLVLRILLRLARFGLTGRAEALTGGDAAEGREAMPPPGARGIGGRGEHR